MSKSLLKQKHSKGFEVLDEYWARLDALEEAVEVFSDSALSFVEEPIERVLEKIRAYEPSVSVIGQVKAGKSTLLNALIGETSLLPTDVNPWTSVITALHLNSRHRPPGTRALFRFFDQHEWDRLVATGGRLGEMAARAGYEGEAEEVRSQVIRMRETTEARLGEEFETLIGSSHAYPDLNDDIINRYICYGDPSEVGEDVTEGVYADLTKTADLYLDVEGLPRGLCLRDTPGVNDTFMMREQITLNAISDSRVCVVVLSAHQALSTVDVAVLRIICAVEAREVLIFVNRIDELADPKSEEEKIRTSLRRTLARQGFDDEIEILFGSGYWANFALSDSEAMAPRSREALATLHPDKDLATVEAVREASLDSSGIVQLHLAIARRVVEGQGAAFLKDLEAEVETIIEMSEMVDNAVEVSDERLAGISLTKADMVQKVADTLQTVMEGFDEAADELRAQLFERLERAQETFADSAIDALQSHVAVFGETGSWDHDPMGLRMAMKGAYSSVCGKLRGEGETAFEKVVDQVEALLAEELGVVRKGDTIDFPEQPQHKPPTVLARTISLDLGGSWWSRIWDVAPTGKFLRARRSRRIESKYRELIEAETAPLIHELIDQCFDPAVATTREIVTTFALDQGRFCEALLERMMEDSSQAEEHSARIKELRRASA
ncbi:MAG: dynamin family protein [Pseudomonadota bacterium]